MNLVVNASDAIRERDGVIRVATECVTVDPEMAALLPEELPEGDYIQLEVSDTGSGMSYQTRGRIFDPFFSTKASGRGLGLPVVHGIVRSLRGAIRVWTEPGEGSIFQVLLPIAETPALVGSEQCGQMDEAQGPSPTGTVLVVEDEASLRRAVSKVLRREGFTVLEVHDGSEAIELLRTKAREIDLVFLDMTIPGKPSHEVLAAAVHGRTDMKVVLTSAYSEEMVKETLSAPQVCAFVRKPFRLAAVATAVRNALAS
jgi:CheY-like chemotaxis protein